VKIELTYRSQLDGAKRDWSSKKRAEKRTKQVRKSSGAGGKEKEPVMGVTEIRD